MLIKQAKTLDVPTLSALAKMAYRRVQGSGDFNEAVSVGSWINYLRAGAGAVFFVVDNSGNPCGAICGYKTNSIDTGKLVAHIYHWFVAEEAAKAGYGIRLLKNFERWAKATGCVLIETNCPVVLFDEAHKKLYPRLGYKFVSCNFIKEL